MCLIATNEERQQEHDEIARVINGVNDILTLNDHLVVVTALKAQEFGYHPAEPLYIFAKCGFTSDEIANLL